MRAIYLSVLAFLVVLAPVKARTPEPPIPTRSTANNFHFQNDIFASKQNDPVMYVLLGSGFLRPTTFGDPHAFVSRWLASHPNAIATPISRSLSTNTVSHQMMEFVYIWIDDGAESLNVDLIRSGFFAGGTMYDMVDNEKGLQALLDRDPEMAEAKQQIAKEKAAAPQDQDERLVSDADYRQRLARIDAAEKSARANKLGIWSDAMKDEREADGLN